LFGSLTDDARKAFEQFCVPRLQIVAKPVAKIPGDHCPHAGNGEQHRTEQEQ
jgi:hypothetical protein